MDSLNVYIPTDRLHALVRRIELPARAQGAALFADISGFTKLTESLFMALGPQRGAEELPHWLNLIYNALIDEVDRHHGSVINFSGDAITCWFDDDSLDGTPIPPASLRATACALEMQKTMKQFERAEVPSAGVVTLAIKVAVSTGPASRFLVGDPNIQLIDVLAGKTLEYIAAGEKLAQKGEVILDEATVKQLGDGVNILEWRTDDHFNIRFASVNKLHIQVPASPWMEVPANILGEEQIRQWVLPPVYERVRGGMGEFLTELRPTVAMFVQFSGIDYDNDSQALSKLDTYIRAVQHILIKYDNYLLQLTIGDKGSYFYVSFGALLASEDDPVRAIAAAIDIRDLRMDFLSDVKIGISQGRTRTGAYGSRHRRTYGSLGDEVNTAARLMQNAVPGQILVNQNVQKSVQDLFAWEKLPSLQVKGRSSLVDVFQLGRQKEKESTRFYEAQYSLPMVGRKSELALFDKKIKMSLNGIGQIVGISGEAGMGKSRLAGEGVRLAREAGLQIYHGECQSYGMNSSYLVWQSICYSFFELDPNGKLEDQVRVLENHLKEIDPALLPRLPLLGAVLNINIPDNDLTRTFDAKLRKESLESLLIDCFSKRSVNRSLFFLFEDCQWLDTLSRSLIEAVGRAILDLNIIIVLTYRPALSGDQFLPQFPEMSNFTSIILGNLPETDISQLVLLKIENLYGENTDIPPQLIEQIGLRAQGNPFYIEELLNYLNDNNVNPQSRDILSKIELPASLYSLILSRIDRLSENQKTLLKVASVIGRLFQASMLEGIYSQFGDRSRLNSDLEVLNRIELTAMDTPEPELAYLFKHILTQEVAYETLPFATRAMIHGLIGAHLENNYSDMIGQYVDLLAHHYDLSENLEKKRVYLLKAGELAQAEFANTAAISYYERLLKVVPEKEKPRIMLKLTQVLDLMGDWKKAEEYNRIVEQSDDDIAVAEARRALGILKRKSGEYSEAETWMKRARDSFQLLEDIPGVSMVIADIGEIHRLQGKFDKARIYYDESLNLAEEIPDREIRQKVRAHALKGAGTVATWQGDYATARKLNEESLQIRRELGDAPGVAALLNNLGIIARFQQDLSSAREMNSESIALFRKLGDRWAMGQLLNNQACVASDQKEYAEARLLLEESLFIRRQLGDKAGLALSLNTLADVVLDEGDFSAARPLLNESILINQNLGDRTAMAYLLEDYGGLAAAEGDFVMSLKFVGFAKTLRDEIGAPLPPAEQARVDRMIAPARAALSEEDAVAAWEAGRSLTLDQALELALDKNRQVHLDPQNVQKACEYALQRLENELQPVLQYHSIYHTRDEVVPAVRTLAEREGVTGEALDLLIVAAWFHDIGYVQQSIHHELIGARIAVEVLPDFGFTKDQAEVVRWIILATALPQSPRNLVEQIMADADLITLGLPTFSKRNADLRRELSLLGRNFSDDEWYGNQIKFLENHRYFTASAIALWEGGKLENIAYLKSILKSNQKTG